VAADTLRLRDIQLDQRGRSDSFLLQKTSSTSSPPPEKLDKLPLSRQTLTCSVASRSYLFRRRRPSVPILKVANPIIGRIFVPWNFFPSCKPGRRRLCCRGELQRLVSIRPPPRPLGSLSFPSSIRMTFRGTDSKIETLNPARSSRLTRIGSRTREHGALLVREHDEPGAGIKCTAPMHWRKNHA
jgi:hypothetical protein